MKGNGPKGKNKKKLQGTTVHSKNLFLNHTVEC